MVEQVECVVIGAGVIGLACARALALSGKEVIILEAENTVGTGISSRNSEVIHAGIYYPKNSNKAKFCVAGKELLYRYCEERALPHKKLGKLIVAVNEDELKDLEKIRQKALDNGVLDLYFMDRAAIKSIEPKLNVVGGLFSPSTGIIDSHQFMLNLLGDAENSGAALIFNSPVISGEIKDNEVHLCVAGDTGNYTIATKYLINAAGLFANAILKELKGFPSNQAPELYYCKGNYFSLSTNSPFQHLIYPMPNSAGLGVHATLDLMGRAKFGPDTQWIDEINYDVDASKLNDFYNVIKTYWPDIPNNSLEPGYTGIRPKLAKAGEQAADFLIQGPKQHGIFGLVNLLGIESPGLTASLAIAEHVVQLI